MPEPPFPQDEEVSPSNPFLEEEEASRRDARPLERALDMLMVTTSRRCPRESDCLSSLLQFKAQYYLTLFVLNTAFCCLGYLMIYAMLAIGDQAYLNHMDSTVVKGCKSLTINLATVL